MEISNTHFIHGAQSIQGPHRMASTGTAAATATQSQPVQDDIRLSEEAKSVTVSEQTEPSSAGIRFELVNRIKSEIAAGTYETADKMDIALDRLISGLSPR